MKRRIGILSALLLLLILLIISLSYPRSPLPDPALAKVLNARLERRLALPERAWTVSFSPDSSLLLIASVGNGAEIRRVSDGSLVRTLEHPQGLTWGVFSHDGH